MKTSSAMTQYSPTKDFERRPHDDEEELPLWPTGSIYERVVTWPFFLSYWNKKFGHLKIRKKGADTCTDCQILCNEFRMRSSVAKLRRMQREQQQEREDAHIEGLTDTEDEEEEEEGDDDACIPAPSEAEIAAEIERMDTALSTAKEHVRQYTVQRRECKNIIQIARQDMAYHLPSLLRRKVLTIDMGQNLCLPNFEAEQPGDTYYLLPLTILLFGVVDNATEDGRDRMHTSGESSMELAEQII